MDRRFAVLFGNSFSSSPLFIGVLTFFGEKGDLPLRVNRAERLFLNKINIPQ